MIKETDISKYMEDIMRWCKDPIKLVEYEKSIREAVKQNKDDDDFLRTSDFIPDDLWKGIVDAINYDSATTVGWATKKLGILYRRSQLGEKVFVPFLNVYLEKSNFQIIICEEFPQFIFNEILETCKSI